MPANLYALLVGVNAYKNASVPDLRGCVADARAMYTWLTTSLGLPHERITLLTSSGEETPDRRASRANILAAWHALINRVEAGDQLFFHYSGHGAQARSIDPNEPDGYDETVVPDDSRDVDEQGRPVYDILDKELAALIDQAEAKGALVTVFLDCCHSGSGTREAAAPDPTKPLTRRGPKDERVRPAESLVAGTRLTDIVEIPTTRDSSGWQIRADSQHVLLAGCRDEELSHEYRAPETGEWHGATTYFLLKALRNYRPEMTWGEVADFVQTRVTAAYESQIPQLEGPRNRQVFGGMAAPALPYLLVTEAEEDGGQIYVRINGGAAVGLTEGSRVAIYPDGSGDLSGTPLASGSVIQTKLDYVYAALESTLTKDQIPIPARVRVTAQGYDSLVYDVAVDEPLVLAALATDAGKSPFLNVVASNDPGARFRVVRRGEALAIQDGSGAQIVTATQPLNEEGALEIARNLHHLAVYNNVRNLRNPTEPVDLARGLTVTAESYTSAGFAGPKDGIPLVDTGNVLTPGRKIWLTVRNDTSETLYVSIFNLDANYGIQRISPSRAPHHTLAPGKSIPIQGISPRVHNPFITQSREILKIFATRAPLSFDVLVMEKLNEPPREVGDVRDAGPLGALLKGIRRQGTRDLVIEEDAASGWITRQVEVGVLVDNEVRALPPGERSLNLGSPLAMALEKPAGFSGDLIISSVGQITRALDAGESVPLPPGLSHPDAQATFRPLSFGGSTRAAQSAAGVLAINSTPDQLSTIDEDNPLRLELTLEDEADLGGILPVAFDGEFFYLAGQTEEASTRALAGVGERRMAVSITHLPMPAEVSGDGGTRTAGDVPTRDLKRTVRLFLYKVYKGGQLPDDTGLRKAERGPDGKPVYSTVSAADVAAAKKVALLVHGFTSDTIWFVEKVMPFLAELGGYDLFLAYDYETFNTTVMENGATLAQALSALKFGADDDIQIDVFCHSMGTQVVRVLVELKGGHAYVDRVFMGGAPNAGTRLAELKKLIFWLGTVALNYAGSTPPALIANWLFKKTVDSAVSIDDLMPRSELYKALNDNTEVFNVPYFVQIGNNAQYDNFDWKKLFSKAGLAKLADATVDQLLGGPNDIAISVASAEAVRHGHWRPLTVAVVPGNHFAYFYTEESVALLRQWL